MPRTQGPRLSQETLLDIELSAICSMNRSCIDSVPVMEERSENRPGDSTELRARVAGTWAGDYRDEHTSVLCDALLEIEGAAGWAPVGQKRRTTAWRSASLTCRGDGPCGKQNPPPSR